MQKKLWLVNLLLAVTMLLPVASAVQAAPLPQQGQDYVIQKGDTLSALAAKYIGQAADAIAIISATAEKATGDASYAKINDPSLIEPGWKIYIPTKDEAVAYMKPLPDLKGRKLRIGTDPTYPPFEYPDKATGKYIGFDIEMVDDLCKRLNCVTDYVGTAYDGIFTALAAKEFDMVVSGSTITPEREKIVDFTYPYLVYGQILLLQEKNQAITKLDDAKGKPIGSQLGTTNEMEAVKLFGDANVKRYDTFDLAVVALINGDVDGVVIDLPSAIGFMQQYPGKLKAGPPLTSGEALGMVFQSGEKELLPAFNSALARFKADGAYGKLYNKYFNVQAPTGTPAATAPVTKTTSIAIDSMVLGLHLAGSDTLVVGTTDKLSVFDPADVYDFHAWEIWNNTGDGLLKNTPGTAGQVEPGLAEKYDVSKNGLEYTFYLRKGVKFPDGTPLTSAQVKGTIDRVIQMNAKLNGEVAFLVSDYVDKVDAIDDSTIKITLKTPIGFFPQLVATNPYKIINPKQWSMDKYEADNTSGGIGPYKITSWKRDEELVMEANPSYYGTQPKTPKVIIRYFADSATMRLALEKGEIDIAWKSLSPADLKSLTGKPGLKVERQPGTEIRYICFNCKTAPFDNKVVRQALSMMLSREEITDVGFQGNKVPLYSMIPPGFLGHEDSYKDTENMAKAKELLTQAGYSDSKPLELDFWYSPTHYGDTEADVAALIKDQWEKSGMVKVKLQNAEWATYKEYRNKGGMPVFLLGWYPDYLDSDNYTYPFGFSTATVGLGVNYNNPEMDKMLQDAQIQTDEAKRADMYKAIQQKWLTENPTVPFAQGALFVAYKDGITGIVLDPLALFHYYLVSKGA